MNNAWDGSIKDPREPSFRGRLTEFGMGELKYMFRIIQTKPMIRYYGANLAKTYKQAIYDRVVSRKVRGIDEFETWEW